VDRCTDKAVLALMCNNYIKWEIFEVLAAVSLKIQIVCHVSVWRESRTSRRIEKSLRLYVDGHAVQSFTSHKTCFVLHVIDIIVGRVFVQLTHTVPELQ
jgi:hypothetical protein